MNEADAVPASRAPLEQDAKIIGLVGMVHLASHFAQLLLAPLFPWLKDAFQVSYTELGFLLTLFFVVSCGVQAASGFLVDRFGPRPILFTGLGLLTVCAFGFAGSTSYLMLALFSILAGVGNGVFHPVDFTIMNRKVSPPRLGHAYSAHGLCGNLGWALAPALLVPLALAQSWRLALAAAGSLLAAVLVAAWFARERLAVAPLPARGPEAGHGEEGSFDFLRIPAVWACFTFFFLFAMALAAIQAFAPVAAGKLHEVPLAWVAACVTIYMVCSGGGMVVGGFLAADPARCERVVAWGIGLAALAAAAIAAAPLPWLAVPVLFGVMGLCTGTAGPSRDLMVKRSTPPNSTGRVYGVVYGGLDVGQALSPLVFGALMDHQNHQGVWLGIVLLQCTLIFTAFNVTKARRTLVVAA